MYYSADYSYFDGDSHWFAVGNGNHFIVEAIDYFGYNKMMELQYLSNPYMICQNLTLESDK